MTRDTSLGRYRLDKHFRLPQFGSRKNPFATAKQTGLALATETPLVPSLKSEPAPAPVVEPIVESHPAAVAESPILEQQVQEPVPQVQPANSRETERPPEIPPVTTKKRSSWLQRAPGRIFTGLKCVSVKMNPLSWLPRRKVTAKTTFSKSARQTTQPQLVQQPELCLENVRVVRNDLNDTDLEIVAAKTPAAANDTPAVKLKRKAMMHASPSLAPAERT